MSVPLSDTRLAELPFGVVLDRPDADRVYAWGPFASFDAATRFAEFVQAEIDPARVIPWDQATALPSVHVVDAVAELLSWRTSVAVPQAAELAASRRRDALNEALRNQAELANWAGQLQSAGLTPHPAFAVRSTTTGYEVAAQVATTDALTSEARERLLAELQVAFDETVRRVLGYRPASLGAGQ